MARFRKIVIIRNMHAGEAMGRHKLVDTAVAAFTERGMPARVYATASLTDLEAVTYALSVDSEPCDLVVIIGGDGTTTCVLTSLLPKLERMGREPPVFLTVPAGTMNIVPTSLRQPTGGSAVRAIREIARKIRDGAPVEGSRLHTLRVNERHGFVFGTGLPANAIAAYNVAETRGPKRAIAMGIRAVADETLRLVGIRPKRESLIKPFAGALRFRDDRATPHHLEKNWTMIMASTVDHVARHCRVMPRAYEKFGSFQLLSTDGAFPTYVLNGLPLVMGHGAEDMDDRLVESCEIDYREPTQRQLDGELLEPARPGDIDRLKIGPLLTFLVP